MTDDLRSLLALLDLETIEPDLYRGQVSTSSRDRVYGGQVAAQALVAAGRTVDDDHFVHSLHAYFMRPGDPSRPIVYDVDRLRDGRSFTTRRVRARQNGKAIFSLEASLHVVEDGGLQHQPTMPDVPGPEDLPSILELTGEGGEEAVRRWGEIGALDFRVDPGSVRDRDRPTVFWFRARGEPPSAPLMHTAIVTFASDWALLSDVLARHGRWYGDEDLMVASLDHAMWFHELRPDASQWMLYEVSSPAAGGARGLGLGRIYAADGTLWASTAQEGLARVVAPRG